MVRSFLPEPEEAVMTKRPYTICWDPRVVGAASAVLAQIIPNCFGPSCQGELAREALEATPGYSLEVVDANTGFHDDALGIGWHSPKGEGTVWLLIPKYRDMGRQDSGETAGWQGPPEVVLDGEATPAHAIDVLEALTRHLGAQRV
jgi:hypothetical protein